MSEPFLAEIRIVSFAFAPRGWALCNGQLLPINQNQALFSLLGTMYGGDGQTNFALPNLQGRLPFHAGSGFAQGDRGGEQNHTLTLSELPTHTHLPVGSPNPPDASAPSGHFWASNTGFAPYSPTANESMSPQAIASAGAGLPHPNMPPFLVLNFVIALQGIFPSRN